METIIFIQNTSKLSTPVILPRTTATTNALSTPASYVVHLTEDVSRWRCSDSHVSIHLLWHFYFRSKYFMAVWRIYHASCHLLFGDFVLCGVVCLTVLPTVRLIFICHRVQISNELWFKTFSVFIYFFFSYCDFC